MCSSSLKIHSLVRLLNIRLCLWTFCFRLAEHGVTTQKPFPRPPIGGGGSTTVAPEIQHNLTILRCSEIRPSVLWHRQDACGRENGAPWLGLTPSAGAKPCGTGPAPGLSRSAPISLASGGHPVLQKTGAVKYIFTLGRICIPFCPSTATC